MAQSGSFMSHWPKSSISGCRSSVPSFRYLCNSSAGVPGVPPRFSIICRPNARLSRQLWPRVTFHKRTPSTASRCHGLSLQRPGADARCHHAFSSPPCCRARCVTVKKHTGQLSGRHERGGGALVVCAVKWLERGEGACERCFSFSEGLSWKVHDHRSHSHAHGMAAMAEGTPLAGGGGGWQHVAFRCVHHRHSIPHSIPLSGWVMSVQPLICLS